MKPILVLTHRIPYPPDKGEKLRAWQWVRALAKTHRVWLGCFVDDASDFAAVPVLRQVCEEVCAVRIHPRWQRIRSLSSLLAGRSLSEAYFFDERLRQWVERVVREQAIDTTLIYSSVMAQYVMPLEGLRRFMDFVDVDSHKWAQYADSRRVLRALYRREARTLATFERQAAEVAEAVFFVTPAEAKLFNDVVCATPNIHAVGNGVDADFFSPAECPSPYAVDEWPLVFTGVMDYWPNVDAVMWFLREVLPRLVALHPRVRLHVVGMRPSREVRALAGAHVVVTGRVPDVRPYLAHARVAVAPLRIARGVQNKVLEAMAMGCAVVASAACAGAIAAQPGVEFSAACDAGQFVAAVDELLSDATRAQQMGQAARERVRRDYTWEAQWRQMQRVIEART